MEIHKKNCLCDPCLMQMARISLIGAQLASNPNRIPGVIMEGLRNDTSK